MADERIFIEVKAINPCVECTTFANCQMPCEKQKKWVESGYGYGLFTEVTMTRQEAIERMAKAMCHSPYESCESCMGQKKKQVCKQALKGMKELAEAALNAIAPMIPQEEQNER